MLTCSIQVYEHETTSGGVLNAKATDVNKKLTARPTRDDHASPRQSEFGKSFRFCNTFLTGVSPFISICDQYTTEDCGFK